jgi:hypothetical protein
MTNAKTLGAGLALGLLVAMAFGQTKAPSPATVTGPARYQITAVRMGPATASGEPMIFILDNRTQAVSSCRQVDGKWESASAFQLPE